METIGSRIRKYREEACLSPQELADAVNRSRGTIYDYEGGNTPVPRPMIKKIAKVLKVSIADLVG